MVQVSDLRELEAAQHISIAKPANSRSLLPDIAQ